MGFGQLPEALIMTGRFLMKPKQNLSFGCDDLSDQDLCPGFWATGKQAGRENENGYDFHVSKSKMNSVYWNPGYEEQKKTPEPIGSRRL
jgi:hypothetical protein